MNWLIGLSNPASALANYPSPNLLIPLPLVSSLYKVIKEFYTFSEFSEVTNP